MKNISNLFACIIVFSFYSCSKSDDYIDIFSELNLPATPFSYTTTRNPLPWNSNIPDNNPITDHGATLGRVLFYDKTLSSSNLISCASCHKQEFSFADNVAKSQGVNGLTNFNSMHLVNVRDQGGSAFFWDRRQFFLEDMVLLPIQDHIEMNITLPEAVSKLKTKAHYPILFNNAFGSTDITSDRISKALSQFIRTLNSYDSKFDRNGGISNTNGLFTPQELLGMQKFFDIIPDPSISTEASCAQCHSGVQIEDFLDYGVPNLSFPLNSNGRGFEDQPVFMKVANLRNVALTAPYGHDGRFATLDELLTNHGNNLTPTDIQNLKKFLLTLTDSNFINDERYSNPFKK
jgi:cytochrome c peroxidase